MDLSTKTVHVGNLSSDVTPEMLKQIFGCIGEIIDVRLSSDHRYGFVDFADAAAATASLAMDGTEVLGHSLRVQRATHQRMFSNQANPPPAPMLSQLQPDVSAMASVTSKAALEALSKTKQQQRNNQQPDANIAFMNPAQQRAALEAKHREMVAKNSSGWGVAKRREETSSSSSSDSDSSNDSRGRRRRGHYRRYDNRRYNNRQRDYYHHRRNGRANNRRNDDYAYRRASRSPSPKSPPRADTAAPRQKENKFSSDKFDTTTTTTTTTNGTSKEE